MPKFELQKGHRVFLGIAGLAFVGSAVGSWFSYKDFTELEQEAEGIHGQIATARNKIRKIEDLEREVIILRQNLQHYVRILPSDAEVNEFYRNLQEFVNFSGVQITELNPQPQRGRVTASEVFDKAEYKLRFDATYSQLLQFINRIENHQRFVSIAEINVKAGDRDDDVVKPLHDVQLSVVTYVYKGNSVGPGVQIPAHDRKRAQLAEQIQEARHDLALDRFSLLSDGIRRDPMVDPRQRISVKEQGADLADQRATLDEITGQIEECHALFDLMDTAGSVMREMELRVEAIGLLTEIQTRVDEVMQVGFISSPNLRREFEAKVLVQLGELRGRAGEAVVDRQTNDELLRVQSAFAQMAGAFENGRYQAVVDTFDMVSSLSGSSNDPEIAAIQAEMEAMYLVSSTALDFMDLELEVSGLVRYPPSDEERESVAIVNRMVYREGEAVADDLFLMEIGEDHLVFEFRGVPLTYDF